MGAPLRGDRASSFVEHAPGELNRAGVTVIAALEDVDCEPRACVVHHSVRERDGQVVTRRAKRAGSEEELRQRCRTFRRGRRTRGRYRPKGTTVRALRCVV